MLFQLIYQSMSTHPRGHISDIQILRKAQILNAELGITGFLLRAPRQFIQILEGDERSVNHVMRRVRKDPNHQIIREMTSRSTVPRMFSEWSMGYANIPATKGIQMSDIFSRLEKDWSSTLLQLKDIAIDFSQNSDPE